MLTECSRDLFGFAPVEGREVVAAFDGGAFTSDAGALLLGATDRAIGMMKRFAARVLRRHPETAAPKVHELLSWSAKGGPKRKRRLYLRDLVISMDLDSFYSLT